MRQALRGLTTRGRAFVAAGITASLCALLLGQKDLLRVGILLVALPVVAALVVGRTRLRLQVRRSLTPNQVPVGSSATVELALSNQGRMPAGLLLLEDRIPYVLGHRPRFVVDRVSPNWRRTVSYPVKSDVRGLFQVGPLMLTVADPFGLVETSRTFTRSQHLLVTPRVHKLPEIRLGADRAGSGENRPRAIAAAGEEDATVREYRDGDDLRRVHWRSTARRGELMVRREEQPWQSRCSIFLDARTISHHGHGPSSSLEWAVSATASIGADRIRRGYVTTMLGGPTTLSAITHRSAAAVHQPLTTQQLLTECATVEEHKYAEIGPLLSVDRFAQEPSLVIAIVGACGSDDITALNRWRTSQATGVAIVLDAASWAVGAEATDKAARLTAATDATEHELRRNGWRVARVRRGDQLATVWSGLGLRSGRIA
ncbi:DUF58 domain-containing protein [Kribbella sandramycini]|uniref:DUF58 domain-containing protein n=1 Tax=Kribbella sandramycini TaxID=60450 RepID=A0A7Y4KUB1_9ACTN|nr:DUF58 domain-containing protein [Kribbella sandramycini]MBB6568563.1 uncharacterized protein (DUF58 family) [Kribbella sandramycini]NOL38850.1 DUF58 domain-containing protein [Kribbella sandramycini]